jgi:hypothetical protein
MARETLQVRMARRLLAAAALAFAMSLAVSACTDTDSGGSDTGSGNNGSVEGTGPTGPPPDVTIPDVLGQKLSRARANIRDAGFSVDVTRKVSTKPEGTVILQRPGGDASARPGRTVTLVVAKPAPEQSSSSNCTPGYSPCLPPAPDYDCAGGSGDGPRYTGFVRVTGSDPYGLDADNDGYGCE